MIIYFSLDWGSIRATQVTSANVTHGTSLTDRLPQKSGSGHGWGWHPSVRWLVPYEMNKPLLIISHARDLQVGLWIPRLCFSFDFPLAGSYFHMLKQVPWTRPVPMMSNPFYGYESNPQKTQLLVYKNQFRRSRLPNMVESFDIEWWSAFWCSIKSRLFSELDFECPSSNSMWKYLQSNFPHCMNPSLALFLQNAAYNSHVFY